eukprot:scaffold3241_cov125-Cylindrotheca_fusiformis.AAC.7
MHGDFLACISNNHVLFNLTRFGVAASRLDAAEFVQLSQDHHKAPGLKSTQEHLILLSLQGDPEPTDTKCLLATTSFLTVPPRLLNGGKDAGVMGIITAGDDNNVMGIITSAVSLRSDGLGYISAADRSHSGIQRLATIHISEKEKLGLRRVCYGLYTEAGGSLETLVELTVNLRGDFNGPGILVAPEDKLQRTANIEYGLVAFQCTGKVANGAGIAKKKNLLEPSTKETSLQFVSIPMTWG